MKINYDNNMKIKYDNPVFWIIVTALAVAPMSFLAGWQYGEMKPLKALPTPTEVVQIPKIKWNSVPPEL